MQKAKFLFLFLALNALTITVRSYAWELTDLSNDHSLTSAKAYGEDKPGELTKNFQVIDVHKNSDNTVDYGIKAEYKTKTTDYLVERWSIDCKDATAWYHVWIGYKNGKQTDIGHWPKVVPINGTFNEQVYNQYCK